MNKKEFLTYKKELLNLIPIKPTISIRNRKIKKGEKFGVYGLADFSKYHISINVYGKQSYLYILLIIAHEVRHFLHIYENKFPKYYKNMFLSKKESKNYIDLIKSGKLKPPSLKNVQDAEDDCNLFAVKVMKKLKIKNKNSKIKNL